ncbi:hypothetical protein EXN66_Car009899 [Channa argus]|uniref:Uncharacterized protein n=1 Tax=Channa argus TaxID=215402 RepID=A0A6G1PVL5_CHAAH|nr:hypothetical protein EXN66_Car009899 [Channa argus]
MNLNEGFAPVMIKKMASVSASGAFYGANNSSFQPSGFFTKLFSQRQTQKHSVAEFCCCFSSVPIRA